MEDFTVWVEVRAEMQVVPRGKIAPARVVHAHQVPVVIRQAGPTEAPMVLEREGMGVDASCRSWDGGFITPVLGPEGGPVRLDEIAGLAGHAGRAGGTPFQHCQDAEEARPFDGTAVRRLVADGRPHAEGEARRAADEMVLVAGMLWRKVPEPAVEVRWAEGAEAGVVVSAVLPRWEMGRLDGAGAVPGATRFRADEQGLARDFARSVAGNVGEDGAFAVARADLLLAPRERGIAEEELAMAVRELSAKAGFGSLPPAALRAWRTCRRMAAEPGAGDLWSALRDFRNEARANEGLFREVERVAGLLIRRGEFMADRKNGLDDDAALGLLL